jgi:hypothetical protein
MNLIEKEIRMAKYKMERNILKIQPNRLHEEEC